MRKSKSRLSFVAALERRAKADSDYWSYKRMGQRPGLHGLIRYPAMMVPQMQSDVMDAAAESLTGLNHVVDPFVGSGTTMIEAVRRGFTFEGYDINPLAVLICRAKLLSLAIETVRKRVAQAIARLDDDRSNKLEVNFFGRDKWFTRRGCVELSRIRRAVAAEPNRELRQFLWVVVAETIRQTSLSRESTYKLHIRPEVEHSHLPHPLERFKQLALDAVARYIQHCEDRKREQRMYARTLLHCMDIRSVRGSKTPLAQLLITSPPYGDNVSTIPYGQFSYLALKWIPCGDLEGDSLLHRSAYAIDTASLGGSSRGYIERALAMTLVSRSFKEFFEALLTQKRPDLEAKAASFTADFFDAIDSSLSRLESGGLAVWTLGERCIGGIRVPLVQICREINQFFGMEPIVEISRSIHSKRMPHKNSQGPTMATETLLVMSKP